MLDTVYTWKWKSTVMFRVCIKYENLYKKQEVVDFVNNLGFSLCAIVSVYHVVATFKWYYYFIV